MNMDMQRFHATFFEESRENLAAMERGMAQILGEVLAILGHRAASKSD